MESRTHLWKGYQPRLLHHWTDFCPLHLLSQNEWGMWEEFCVRLYLPVSKNVSVFIKKEGSV